MVATIQSRLSGHPSKYRLRAAMLDFDDRWSHALNVQLPVSMKAII